MPPSGAPPSAQAPPVLLQQSELTLPPRPRGIHLITREVLQGLPGLRDFACGVLNLCLQHTSASLFLGENADADVRADLERWADRAAPDGASYFVHTAEGDDDMPAHVKSALFGTSLTLPLRDGRPRLGTWQGIYLGEHRDHGGARTLVATAWGTSR